VTVETERLEAGIMNGLTSSATRELAPVIDPPLIRRPLGHCPACGSARLVPVVEADVEEVHFFCDECGRCWHVELGYVHRVRPDTCHGCARRERCTRVFAGDHP